MLGMLKVLNKYSYSTAANTTTVTTASAAVAASTTATKMKEMETKMRSPVQSRCQGPQPAALSSTGPGIGLQVVLELDETVRDIHAIFWGRIHSYHGLDGVSNPQRFKPHPSQV